MRARFFWIIFSVLTIVALGATFLHGQMLRNDRLARVDAQIRESAEKVLNSRIARAESITYEEADKILTEELGDLRIGKIFVVRDTTGKIFFQSIGARLLPFRELPLDPTWATLYNHGKLVRILNLPVPGFTNRTLQAGLVVDNSLISPSFLSPGNMLFISAIFLLGLISSWALTSTLLRPISHLVNFISSISPESSIALPPLPKELARLSPRAQKGDELSLLVESFSSLMAKVNRGYRLSRVWSYQMAHEMKTPLAIMEGEISNARKAGSLNAELASTLLKELMEVSDTVTEFLTWAELEGATAHKNLYAVSARSTLTNIQKRMENKFGSRIQVNIQEDFYVLSNVQHFEHLLLNVITNALAYSPAHCLVEITSSAAQTILIRDSGPGFSPAVLDRLGEPFNRGDIPRSIQGKGNGLGLAYVKSVCRLYGWELQLSSDSSGAAISLHFPCLGDDSLDDSPSSPQSIENPLAHPRT